MCLSPVHLQWSRGLLNTTTMTSEPALKSALSTLCLTGNATCSNAAAKALITINTELAAIEVGGAAGAVCWGFACRCC